MIQAVEATSCVDPQLKRNMTRLRFWPRLIKSIRKRYLRSVHGDAPFITEYFGARFIVHWGDHVAREVALKTFERVQIEHFIAACRRRRPEVFIDIGAHRGLYSCILLKQDLIKRAILFEPDPVNLVYLRANLHLNGVLERAEVSEHAVGRARSRARMLAGPASNTGRSHVSESGEGGEINVVALDDIVQFHGQALAIKIDIEGYELEALAGMQRTLRDNHGFVQIETSETRREVVQAMNACGYAAVQDFYWDLFFEKSRHDH